MPKDTDEIADLKKRIELLEVLLDTTGPGVDCIRTQHIELMGPNENLLMRLYARDFHSPSEDPCWFIAWSDSEGRPKCRLRISAKTGAVTLVPQEGKSQVLFEGSS